MRPITLKLMGLILLVFSVSAFAGGKHMVIYTSKDGFDTVSAVTDAIAGQGLVINTTSHIGEMLERTGKDMGARSKF